MIRFDKEKYRIVCEYCHLNNRLKNENLKKDSRKEIWSYQCGKNFKSNCFLCKENITVINFQRGHNKSRSKGGKSTPKNVKPICNQCNFSQGTKTFKEFKINLENFQRILDNNS
jgi:5-methylcytosine-specific restriction endonuclease McrA